jgi:DNA-directed RNA polymerase specialized sigma24 family protein
VRATAFPWCSQVNAISCRIPASLNASDPAPARATLKKDWILNDGAFQRFLKWLDGDTNSGGESYLEIRRRLVFYFDRRNCASPDELADETLNRVARRLEEEGAITDASPAHYCYIVAKYVFLESVRAPESRGTSVDDLSLSAQAASRLAVPALPDADDIAKEKRLNCLEICLRKLQSADQEMILEYYQGEQRAKIQRRSQLAERLGFTMNALTIRVCRIRTKLELWVKTCTEET